MQEKAEELLAGYSDIMTEDYQGRMAAKMVRPLPLMVSQGSPDDQTREVLCSSEYTTTVASVACHTTPCQERSRCSVCARISLHSYRLQLHMGSSSTPCRRRPPW